MCYLLIGNISALISDDCKEPLAGACLRVYLPDGRNPKSAHPKNNTFIGPGQLTAGQVEAKRERLLAETRLDKDGNFTLTWEQLHLFTEPLEVDICFRHMPGQAKARGMETHYHLSIVTPQWQRSGPLYVGAYAYVLPVECWRQIRANYGTWVIAGTVRRLHAREGQAKLTVKAYNAANRRLIGTACTDGNGRYQLRFSREQLTGRSVFNRDRRNLHGPDLYFKVYRGKLLLWEEEVQVAATPARKGVSSCSVINITMQDKSLRRTGDMFGWLNSWGMLWTKVLSTRLVIRGGSV